MDRRSGSDGKIEPQPSKKKDILIKKEQLSKISLEEDEDAIDSSLKKLNTVERDMEYLLKTIKSDMNLLKEARNSYMEDRKAVVAEKDKELAEKDKIIAKYEAERTSLTRVGSRFIFLLAKKTNVPIRWLRERLNKKKA